MSLSNVLKDRVSIQVKTTVLGALGETVIWAPVETRNARVANLSTRALLHYQQTETNATHMITFRGSVSLALDDNRFLWKGKTFEPVEPPKEQANSTTIVVREV